MVAEEPSWWNREDPGLTLGESRIEIRTDEDAFDVVLPDGDEVTASKVDKVLAASTATTACVYWSARVSETGSQWTSRIAYSSVCA